MAKRRISHLITENASYKLVALMVTVILWVTILGRRDFTMVRDVEVSVAVPAGYQVLEQGERVVQVRVGGSRMALKKFLSQNSRIEVEAMRVQEGVRYVAIPVESLDLPFGVRLLSITPARVQIQVKKVGTSSGN
jgi:hypothetical protein